MMRMRNPSIPPRRLLSWMALSIAIHVMIVSWLTVSAKDVDPITDRHTLWVSMRQSNTPAVPTPESIGQQALPLRHPPATGDERSDTDSRSRETTPAQDAKTPSDVVATTAEPEMANHMLGLIHRTIREHFVYPPFAWRQGWEGEVVIALQLNSEGEISNIRLVQSSGYRILDEDALLIMRRIGSIPDARAWLNGRSYRARIPVIYRLTS